jgi:hypothetical protein
VISTADIAAGQFELCASAERQQTGASTTSQCKTRAARLRGANTIERHAPVSDAPVASKMR